MTVIIKHILIILILCFVSSLTTFSQPASVESDAKVENQKKVETEETSKTVFGKIQLPPEKTNPVRIARFTSKPVIDGRLDEDIWKQASVFKDFYQINPGDNTTPTNPTEAFLGYDEKFLYFGVRAFEDPAKLRATLAKRDAVLDDDHVRLFLDTFGDGRRAYLLIFNPFGIQQDGIYTEGVGIDLSVDIVMESKGVITGDGYTIEAAIPFKSLRYEAGDGKQWGIDVLRAIKHANSEISSWMPRDRRTSSVLGQFGRLTGLTEIDTERTVELIPSLTVSQSGRRARFFSPGNPVPDASGRFINDGIKFDPGLTAKIGITPAVTLDLAVNPDFAQVEADAPVILANQRFPIFFEEKRPFFLEGVEIFQTMMNAVNTRAIVDPDYAAKLTGRRGRNTFGLLVASDNAPGNFSKDERNDPNLRSRIAPFLDKNAFIGVLRLKRSVGEEREFGFTATSYDFVEKHNRLGGFDGRYRFDPQTVFSFQVLGTTSRRFFFDHETGNNIYRTGNGFGYGFLLERTSRNFTASLSGSGRTRDYRADVGFTRRVNTNMTDLFLTYNSNPDPNRTIISWSFSQFNRIQYDWQGRLQVGVSSTFGSLNFKKQTFFRLGFENIYERVFEEEFEAFGGRRTPTRSGAFFGSDGERSAYNRRIFFDAGSIPGKRFSFSLRGSFNFGALDLDLGAGRKFPRVSPPALADPQAKLDPGAGNAFDFSGTFNYKPTDSLQLTLDYTKSRLVRNDTGLEAFDVNIFSFRALNQFTRSIFVRTRVDYNTLTAGVRGQLVAGWAPSPGKSFYIGYNDDLNYNGFNPFNGRFEPGFSRNGRTFFVKMSYLFRTSF